MVSVLSIGEAARRSGCTVATIRFYEEMGLIAKAELQFVRRARYFWLLTDGNGRLAGALA